GGGGAGLMGRRVQIIPISLIAVRVRDPVAAARLASNSQSRTWRFYRELDRWMNKHHPIQSGRCWIAVAFLEQRDTSAWGECPLSRHSTRQVPARPRAIR